MRRRSACLIALIFACLGLLATTAQTCADRGDILRETYHSSIAGSSRFYSLYLPPCYEYGSETYPLLLLLHGSNADDSQWLRLGFLDALEAGIAQGTVPPMIVIMPFGDAIANQNRFDGGSYDLILLELLDYARQRYRTDGRQAIGGISRGGFWAYHLGLRFPEAFLGIGGHSPFFDADHAGSSDNPLDLAQQLPADTALRLWLDRGSRDFAAVGVDQMHLHLKRRNIPHAYRVYAGDGHDPASWRLHIDEYLAFYAEVFAGPVAADITDSKPPEAEVELWIVAGGFAALRASISRAELQALLAGAHNPQLMLGDRAESRLQQRGFVFHPDVRRVADAQLERLLWRDKLSFTLVPFDELNLRLRPLWLDDRPVVDQLDDYPLVWESDSPNYSPDSLTRITLSGTTALARGTLPALDDMGIATAASGIQDYVTSSDFFHMTNEASIAPGCPQFTDDVLGGANSLCMKTEHARIFNLLEADLLDLTGNHINDFGYDAFSATLDLFSEGDITIAGAGPTLAAARAPIMLEHNDNRIAWLACNAVGPYYALVNEDPQLLGGVRPGAAFCDPEWLQDALPVLAAEAELVVVTIHYREHEDYTPTARQRQDYRRLAEWGADVVVGTAEHKPMVFEFYEARRGETAFIHYGLGNLYFDQDFWGNRRFFLDTLYVYEGQLLTVEIYPGIIDNRARPRLLTGDDQFNFLHFMLIQQNGF